MPELRKHCDEQLQVFLEGHTDAFLDTLFRYLETQTQSKSQRHTSGAAEKSASPTRERPAPGDIRILLSQVGDKPLAMVYNYNAPDTPRDKRVRYFSDAGGEVFVDQVHEVDGAMILVTQGKNGYTLEAALPWKALGVTPPKLNTKIRGDVGVLLGDEHGLRTVERRYWAAKNQTVVADTPTEVRATPILWGELYVTDADPTVKFGPDAGTNEP